MDEGPEVAEALSEFLEMRVRLFRYIHDENLYQNLHPYRPLRNVDPNFAKDQVTTFTDGFPYLIVNQVRWDTLFGILGCFRNRMKCFCDDLEAHFPSIGENTIL